MASGTVKWFNGPSGFGVITADAGGCELSSTEGASSPLNDAGRGDRVEFEV